MIQPYEYPIIKRQVKLAINSVIGGYENAISDGHITITELPGIESLVEEIFSELTNNTYYEGGQRSGPLPCIDKNKDDSMLFKMLIITELFHDDFITDYINQEGWGKE